MVHKELKESQEEQEKKVCCNENYHFKLINECLHHKGFPGLPGLKGSRGDPGSGVLIGDVGPDGDIGKMKTAIVF